MISLRFFRVRSAALVSALPTAALAQGNAEPAASAIIALLPHDLSPWSMFLSASLVVKLVMIALAACSVITWTVFLAKTVELARVAARRRDALAGIETARSLSELRPAADESAAALVEGARAELSLSSGETDDRDGIKERVASRFERIEAAAGRRLAQGTGILATIGATAPFVGLFGTVWGIMNSFIGISKAQTTNLAVVAPGIAEALLATAIGLVAAIPAVVIYNHFSRRIAAAKALTADISAAVLRLVSRDLGRHPGGRIDEPDLRVVAE